MDSIDPIKPRNEITLAEFNIYKKRMVAQRKYNGCRSTCTITKKGKAELWSRSFSKVTNERISYSGKMPHIVAELDKLGLPPDTVLDGELVSLRGGDKDYFDDIKHCTVGHDQTNADFQKNTGYWATWVVFDIPFLGGRALHELTYEERYEVLQTLFKGKKLQWIKIIESESVENTTPEKLCAKAVKLGYEGYVLKNLDSTYPITTFGKADKPGGTWWKVVPKKVGDVVVTGYELGTPGSKYQDVVGKLVCVQYDLDGKEIHVCNVGTGFDDAERARLLTVKYPKVARVEYRFRREDNNKMIHPAWLGFREEDDKQPEECIVEELL